MPFTQLVLFAFFVSYSYAIQVPSPYFNISQYTLDLTFGSDMVLERRYDLQKFLFRICNQSVEVAKNYVRNNQVKSGDQLIGFMTDQHYFDEFYDACSRKYEVSWAKAGQFLACSTVLEPIVEQLKGKLQEQGANIVNENKQICYQPGLKLCDKPPPTHSWNVFESSPVKKFQMVFSKYATIY